jgi:hypothetical protein
VNGKRRACEGQFIGFFHTAATGDRRYDLPSSHERKKAGQVSLPGFD